MKPEPNAAVASGWTGDPLTLRVTRRQRTVLARAVAEYHPDTRAALVHVLASSLRLVWKKTEDGVPWVPVAARFVEAHFCEAELAALVGDGVLESKPHDRAAERSREFRPTTPFLLEFLGAEWA